MINFPKAEVNKTSQRESFDWPKTFRTVPHFEFDQLLVGQMKIWPVGRQHFLKPVKKSFLESQARQRQTTFLQK